MDNRNHELIKNTFILGIGQLVPKFINVLVIPILTTYLSKEVYGSFDYILSIGSFLIPLLTLQIQQAVFRFLLAKEPVFDKKQYISTSIVFLILSSLVVLPIVGAYYFWIKHENILALFVCFFFFFEAFYTLMCQITRATSGNIKYSIAVVIYSLANIFVLYITVAQLGFGLFGVVGSLGFSYMCACIYMVFFTGISKDIALKNCSKSALKELLSFSVPIIPSSIALWIVNLSDRLIVIRFLGLEANGIYGIANKIPTVYNSAYGVFNLSWTETATKAYDENDSSKYYNRIFSELFKFLVGVMLALMAITPILFKLLVKGDYGEAYYHVPILYFGVFFDSFVTFFSGIYLALKRTKTVGISSVLGAIINILINISLINRIGLFAASISTAISFMVIALYRAIDIGRQLKINYNIKELSIGILSIVISAYLIIVRSVPSIVCSFLIAIVYNIIFNRKFVFMILKYMMRLK